MAIEKIRERIEENLESLKKFTAIILLGKPASIALYSMGLYTAMLCLFK